jgi:hypothetical protein
MTMKVATVNTKRKPGKSGPASSHLKMQSLRSGISPIAMGTLFVENAKLGSGSESSSFGERLQYRKALRTDSTVEGGLVPIAFGADSVASALHLHRGRDPSADALRLPRPLEG